jgi:hypothetical protein
MQWDNPTMVVALDAKRRLTIPTALAPAKPGDYFDAHFDAEEDAIVFRRLGGRENWLAVMKECPVSPDDVPPRRRDNDNTRGVSREGSLSTIWPDVTAGRIAIGSRARFWRLSAGGV